jgi:hypothetical protein
MTMPEAAMNEDDLAAGGEDEVRVAGEIGGVEAEAIAEPMDERAHAKLGGGALGANAGHAFGALRNGE